MYSALSNTGALSLMSVMATVMFIVFVEDPLVTLSNKQTVKTFYTNIHICQRLSMKLLVFSACVAAVKSRPVLHHCVHSHIFLVLRDHELYMYVVYI